MFTSGGIMGPLVPALRVAFCTVVELVVEITMVQTALGNLGASKKMNYLSYHIYSHLVLLYAVISINS